MLTTADLLIILAVLTTRLGSNHKTTRRVQDELDRTRTQAQEGSTDGLV